MGCGEQRFEGLESALGGWSGGIGEDFERRGGERDWME